MSTSAKPGPHRLLPFANVVVAQLSVALAVAGSFVVTPAVLHGLGDSAYGGWLLINSFISYMRLLDLGTSSGTVKYGAGALERGDQADLARVFNTSTAIFLTVAAMTMVGTLAFAGILPHIYPAAAQNETATILMLGGALAIDLGLRTFASGLRTRSLFFIFDSIEIAVFSVFKLGLVLYFAHKNALSYRVLALLTLGETVVRNVFVIGAALVWSPFTRRVNPLRAERTMFKKLAVIGGAVSIIDIADIVRFQVDAGVIGYLLPDSPESISIFGIGSRLPSLAYSTIGVIGTVLIPRFSALSETGDKKNVASLLRQSSLATGLVSSFVLVNLAVLGPHFLELWLHQPWVPTSGLLLRLMLPGYYVALLAGPGAGLLLGRGQPRGLMIITVVEAFANFVLSVILIRWFGLVGVALGTAIPMVIVRGFVFPVLLKGEIDLAPSEYVRMNARPTLIGIVYLVLVVGFAFVPTPGYGRFFLLTLATTIVYAVLVAFAIPEARGVLRVLLRRLGVTKSPSP